DLAFSRVCVGIAVPNLMRSRIAANEASSVVSILTLKTAEVTYSSTYPNVGFTCTLGNMAPPAGTATPTSTSAGLIDNVLASGVKSGYSFALGSCAGTPITNYVSTGVPITVGQTGQRAFCSD